MTKERSAVDCQMCAGTGLVKFFWLRQWMVGQCERCGGWGVDPTAKPQASADGEELARRDK